MAGSIQDPAGFVPLHAIAFGSDHAPATPVDAAHPLPVVALGAAAQSTPLSGNTAASGEYGPFVPDLGLPIWISLSGSWAGSARLLRSVDGGATRLPLTAGGEPWASFTGNAQEIVGEESDATASYWLSIVLTSGTASYRVSQ